VIVVACALLAIVAVPLTGGRLSRLSALRLRATWLPVAALAVQTLAVEGVVPDGPPAVALHVGSYVVCAAWLWLNRGVPGLVLAGAGGMLNMAAIVTNGGVMPTHPWAARVAGLQAEAGFENSAVTADAPLWFLGDVLPIPQGWPLANVVSVGDILLVVGLSLLLHRTCRTPHPRDRHTGSAEIDARAGAPAA
jgi:hypothetical protein